MNPFSANYQPNQAVNEYQTALKAQKTVDAATLDVNGTREDYVLSERVADWNQLRNLGAGNAGLDVYSTGHLKSALAALSFPDLFAPSNSTYHFTRAEQFERIEACLADRL